MAKSEAYFEFGINSYDLEGYISLIQATTILSLTFSANVLFSHYLVLG